MNFCILNVFIVIFFQCWGRSWIDVAPDRRKRKNFLTHFQFQSSQANLVLSSRSFLKPVYQQYEFPSWEWKKPRNTNFRYERKLPSSQWQKSRQIKMPDITFACCTQYMGHSTCFGTGCPKADRSSSTVWCQAAANADLLITTPRWLQDCKKWRLSLFWIAFFPENLFKTTLNNSLVEKLLNSIPCSQSCKTRCREIPQHWANASKYNVLFSVM